MLLVCSIKLLLTFHLLPLHARFYARAVQIYLNTEIQIKIEIKLKRKFINIRNN